MADLTDAIGRGMEPFHDSIPEDDTPIEVLEVMEATGMDLQDALVYLNVKNGGPGDVVEVPE